MLFKSKKKKVEDQLELLARKTKEYKELIALYEELETRVLAEKAEAEDLIKNANEYMKLLGFDTLEDVEAAERRKQFKVL